MFSGLPTSSRLPPIKIDNDDVNPERPLFSGRFYFVPRRLRKSAADAPCAKFSASLFAQACRTHRSAIFCARGLSMRAGIAVDVFECGRHCGDTRNTQACTLFA